MKKLRAVKEVRYAGKNRFPGDEFEAADTDAMILCAKDISGGPKAEFVEQSEINRPEIKQPETRDMAAEDLEDPEPASATPKRRYMRRDMKAHR